MKSALITGAAGGLGIPTVRGLLALGYHVYAVDIDISRLAAISGTTQLTIIEKDLTNTGEVRSLAIQLDLEEKGLDLLICLAGVYETFPVTEADPEKFNRIMSVNFLSTANVIQAFLSPLLKNHGRIMVVSSESYKIQAVFQPYMISKAALEAYCRVAWQELKLKGVRLSVIRPGAINTPLLDWMEKPAKLDTRSHYAGEFDASFKQSKRLVGKISEPDKIAGKIIKAAMSARPRRIYHVYNNPLLKMIGWFPSGWLDRLIVWKFRIK